MSLALQMIIAATVLVLFHAPGGAEVHVNPHEVTSLRLSDAARVIAIGLVDLRLQHRLLVPRLHTDHW